MNHSTLAKCIGACLIGIGWTLASFWIGYAQGERQTIEIQRAEDEAHNAWMRTMNACNWAEIMARDHCSVPLPHLEMKAQ